jgi:branched-chain amino acid aminotransferase
MLQEHPSGSAFRVEPHPTPTSPERRRELMENLAFGRLFSDHMFVMPFSRSGGWGPGVVKPYGKLELDPAANVLHYGQAIFEGFKAYSQAGGGVSTFRPLENGRRFARSAARLAMPELPPETFVAAADALIGLDREWVPRQREQSYYLRPLLISTEAALGVRPADEYLFVLFGSPSGAYFKGGVRPVKVWLTPQYVRAARGGTGAAKCAGNYAASLVAQREAQEQGCDQVLWLDSVNHTLVEEMGGMNVMFVFNRGGRPVITTPALGRGTILPGITRDSLLTLAADLGYDAEEREVELAEVLRGTEDGTLLEAFACGTAAVITPIGELRSAEGAWRVGDGGFGTVANELRGRLLDIQHGAAPDTHGWMHRVL